MGKHANPAVTDLPNGRTRSYMGRGLDYGSLINPKQGDMREADREEFPARSINSHKGSSAKFNSGPPGNMGCTMPGQFEKNGGNG